MRDYSSLFIFHPQIREYFSLSLFYLFRARKRKLIRELIYHEFAIGTILDYFSLSSFRFASICEIFSFFFFFRTREFLRMIYETMVVKIIERYL